MEVNAVVAQQTVPPAEAKPEAGQGTGDFTKKLREAEDSGKPAGAESGKDGKTVRETHGEQQEEDTGETEILLPAAGAPVYVRRAAEGETQAVPKEGAAQARSAWAVTDGKDGQDTAEGAQRSEAGPIPQQTRETNAGPIPQPAPDAAEEFAEKALREVKEQLETANRAAGKTPQAYGETPGEVRAEAPAQGGESAGQQPDTAARESGKAPAAEWREAQKPAETVKTRVQPQAEPVAAEPAAAAGTAAAAKDAAPTGLKTPAAPASENMFSEIVRRVEAAAGEGKSELFVQLKPEHLGGLSISLSMGEDGLTAKIVTREQSVHGMLSGGLAGLQEALRERGIQVAHMEAAWDAGPGTDDPPGGRRDWTARQGFWTAAADGKSDDAIGFYTNLSSFEVLAEHGGSVEFSA